MLVFISWSGRRSKRVAMALRNWLKLVIQRAEPWMSEVDIDAGSQWTREISSSLSRAGAGIICVTSENVTSPWLLFEAGALSKAIDDSQTRVIPYLIDHASPADLEGPLSTLHAVTADRAGTFRLVQCLNAALDETALPAPLLESIFDMAWDKLEPELAALDGDGERVGVVRKERDMIQEILTSVRRISEDVQQTASCVQALESHLWEVDREQRRYEVTAAADDVSRLRDLLDELKRHLGAEIAVAGGPDDGTSELTLRDRRALMELIRKLES